MPKSVNTGLSQLANKVADNLDVSRPKVQRALRAMFDEIRETAQAGGAVKIRDFGTFEYRARKARMGRNPRTGDPVAVAPSRGLAFRASKSSKEVAKPATAKKSSKAK